MVMKDACAQHRCPLAHERNSIFKYKQHTNNIISSFKNLSKFNKRFIALILVDV